MQKQLVIYTHLGQTRSQMIIGKLMTLKNRGDVPDHHIIAAESCEVVDRIKEGLLVGVALVDADTSRFTMRHHEKPAADPSKLDIPGWAAPARYVVFVGLGSLKGSGYDSDHPDIKFAARRAEGCALQLAADFGRNLGARLDAKQLPWGPRRKAKQDNTRPHRSRKHHRHEGSFVHNIHA